MAFSNQLVRELGLVNVPGRGHKTKGENLSTSANSRPADSLTENAGENSYFMEEETDGPIPGKVKLFLISGKNQLLYWTT